MRSRNMDHRVAGPAPSPKSALSWICLLVGLAALTAACASGPEQPSLLMPDVPKPPPSPLPPIEQKVGVELIAQATGDTVYVTVINHTNKPILVGPKFFAVRMAGQIYPFNPGSMKYQFPVRQLGREDGASGVLQFRGLGSLVGATLVLKSPDVPPQAATIQQQVVAGPVPRPR